MRSEEREAAYVEFVTARQTHLRRLAYALCGDWDHADQLLSRALTRLYVAWPRQQRAGTEEQFVRRILVRADLDKTSRLDHQTANATDPDASDLFATLLSLPAKQRKVAVLHLWLGLSVEETAADLGLTTRTVTGLAARATAALDALPAREDA